MKLNARLACLIAIAAFASPDSLAAPIFESDEHFETTVDKNTGVKTMTVSGLDFGHENKLLDESPLTAKAFYLYSEGKATHNVWLRFDKWSRTRRYGGSVTLDFVVDGRAFQASKPRYSCASIYSHGYLYSEILEIMFSLAEFRSIAHAGILKARLGPDELTFSDEKQALLGQFFDRVFHLVSMYG